MKKIYYVFARIESAHIAGVGADRGDIISARLATKGFTKFESAHAVIYKKEMTVEELAQMRRDMYPRQNFVAETLPPDMEKEPEKYLAWSQACERERASLPRYGLRIDFDRTPAILAQLDKVNDLAVEVQPFGLFDAFTEIKVPKIAMKL